MQAGARAGHQRKRTVQLLDQLRRRHGPIRGPGHFRRLPAQGARPPCSRRAHRPAGAHILDTRQPDRHAVPQHQEQERDGGLPRGHPPRTASGQRPLFPGPHPHAPAGNVDGRRGHAAPSPRHRDHLALRRRLHGTRGPRAHLPTWRSISRSRLSKPTPQVRPRTFFTDRPSPSRTWAPASSPGPSATSATTRSPSSSPPATLEVPSPKLYNVEGIDVVLLYQGRIPAGPRTTTTALPVGIQALEVDGAFDDGQGSLPRRRASGRPPTHQRQLHQHRPLDPQATYYASAVHMMGENVLFSVPSGNFGNLAAGLLAHKMGMPCKGFIAATNANSVVPEYLATGDYQPRRQRGPISNAMDVGAQATSSDLPGSSATTSPPSATPSVASTSTTTAPAAHPPHSRDQRIRMRSTRRHRPPGPRLRLKQIQKLSACSFTPRRLQIRRRRGSRNRNRSRDAGPPQGHHRPPQTGRQHRRYLHRPEGLPPQLNLEDVDEIRHVWS